ncbi:MAG: nitroreductase family protein [Actinomycetia bacterium]|nr:nitroreductase family protein [Actinomycetes bacterium]
MELQETLLSRRSVRKFSSKEVEKNKVIRAIELADLSPSAHNSRPWRFDVIYNKDLKTKIAEVHDGKLDKKLIKGVNFPNKLRVKLIMLLAKRVIKNAPVIIVVWNTCPLLNLLKDYDKSNIKYQFIHDMEIESVSNAIYSIHLALHSMGIGSVWMGIPVLKESEIKDILKSKDQLVSILAVGYPLYKSREKKIRDKNLFVNIY